MILRNWLGASLLARDKIACQRPAQRWSEQEEGCQAKTEQSAGRGSSSTSDGCEEAERRSAPMGKERGSLRGDRRTLNCLQNGDFSTGSCSILFEPQDGENKNLLSVFLLSVFLLHPCAVTFICLHATPTPLILRSVALAVFLDKPFSHSGINFGSSIATLSRGENKFAG